MATTRHPSALLFPTWSLMPAHGGRRRCPTSGRGVGRLPRRPRRDHPRARRRSRVQLRPLAERARGARARRLGGGGPTAHDRSGRARPAEPEPRLAHRRPAGGASLVERISCPSDSRGVYAAITDAGRSLTDEALQWHWARVNERFFASLSDEQAKSWARSGRRYWAARSIPTTPRPARRPGAAGALGAR